MRRLEDRIFEFLRDAGTAVSSAELARRFFHLAGSGEQAAARVIESALGRDSRFTRDNDGWQTAGVPEGLPALGEIPWVVFLGKTFPPGGAARSLLVKAVSGPGETGTDISAWLAGSGKGLETAAGETAEQLGFSCQALSELRLFRELEEVLIKPGLFLTGFQSGPAGRWLAQAEEMGTALPDACYPIRELFQIAMERSGPPRLDEVRAHYRLNLSHEDPLVLELRALPELLPALRRDLAALGIERADELAEGLAALHPALDFTPYSFTRQDLLELPAVPGVYRFYNRQDQVLYVGKSVNVRRRVSSYFRWRDEQDLKLERLQRETLRLAVEETGSDLAALLKEVELIRLLQPPVNVQMEIHEQAEGKKLEDLLLVLLPAAEDDRRQLFAFHPAGVIYTEKFSRSFPDLPLLERFLTTAAGGGGVPDPAFALALRWLRKNSHQLTYFRYHDYPAPADLATAILQALSAEPSPERLLYR